MLLLFCGVVSCSHGRAADVEVSFSIGLDVGLRDACMIVPFDVSAIASRVQQRQHEYAPRADDMSGSFLRRPTMRRSTQLAKSAS